MKTHIPTGLILMAFVLTASASLSADRHAISSLELMKILEARRTAELDRISGKLRNQKKMYRPKATQPENFNNQNDGLLPEPLPIPNFLFQSLKTTNLSI